MREWVMGWILTVNGSDFVTNSYGKSWDSTCEKS